MYTRKPVNKRPIMLRRAVFTGMDSPMIVVSRYQQRMYVRGWYPGR